MSFEVIVTKPAQKDLKRIDPVIKKKLKKKIEIYSKKPLSYARVLIDKRIGRFRWKIGKYRVVFDIEGKKLIILRIDHRREIYK